MGGPSASASSRGASGICERTAQTPHRREARRRCRRNAAARMQSRSAGVHGARARCSDVKSTGAVQRREEHGRDAAT
eukprot:210453-Chlamydomonas_euryale.AAC.1